MLLRGRHPASTALLTPSRVHQIHIFKFGFRASLASVSLLNYSGNTRTGRPVMGFLNVLYEFPSSV